MLCRLKKKKSYSKKHNFMEQLLGAARLLSDVCLLVVYVFLSNLLASCD